MMRANAGTFALRRRCFQRGVSAVDFGEIPEETVMSLKTSSCVVVGILVAAALAFAPPKWSAGVRAGAGRADSQSSATTDAALPAASTMLEVEMKPGPKFFALPDTQGAVAAAKQKSDADPKNTDLLMKLDQEQVKVWEYREAVATCTRGLAIAPANAAFYVERGHREVALQRFPETIADMQRAIELDPSIGDIYYHLGLAHYFRGEFAQAAEAFQKAVTISQAKGAASSDGTTNSTNWLYVSLRRAGKKDEAAKALEAVGPEVMTKDAHSQVYLNLVRFYQGRMKESDVVEPEPPRDGHVYLEPELKFDTSAYQVGNWYLYNGNPAKAREYFARVAKGGVWVTWGFIGSQIEMQKKQ